jgi:hypothetical protein
VVQQQSVNGRSHFQVINVICNKSLEKGSGVRAANSDKGTGLETSYFQVTFARVEGHRESLRTVSEKLLCFGTEIVVQVMSVPPHVS